MVKILRKYTTIPQALYVERNADSQLKQIIEDMDRPGYVLVARQMGKTNLLLNAKRQLENKNDIYTYIDFSNVFLTDRDCYRNIIDTILETHEDTFIDLTPLIEQGRKDKDLPPHKEHIKELRSILKSISGKLVIIIDEIDAIRTSDYSDKIFAQIRSTYFARTNYPEFENLTYILSGVIEPSELIKDRNKSPFNIGEKIYLDDFKYDEHLLFLNKSKLNLSTEISKHVYNWTKGNPRLTFDICSSIEDEGGETISAEEVDSIIKKKYLKSFDIAPIDHIRELVKSDKIIRQAVRTINNIEGNISDEIKRRLYLYGIISSDFDSIQVEFKNRIVEKSLTNEWLDSIDRSSPYIFGIGLEQIINKEFKSGIDTLSGYLEHTEKIDNYTKELVSYHIGLGYFNLQDYDRAYEKFNLLELNEDKVNIDIYYSSISYRGIILLKKGEVEKGVLLFNKVLKEYHHGFAYRSALLNLAKHYSETKPKESLLLFNTLVEQIEDANEIKDLNLEEVSSVRSSIYLDKCKLLFNIGKPEEAIREIIKIKKDTQDKFLPLILLYEYKYNHTKDCSILTDIVQLIVNNKVEFDNKEGYSVSFNETILFQIFIELFDSNLKDDIESLLDYAIKIIYNNRKTKYDLLLTICRNIVRYDVVINICKQIIKNEVSINNKSILLETYRLVSMIQVESKYFWKSFNMYLSFFEQSEDKIVDKDIILFSYGIRKYYEANSTDKALFLCEKIEKRFINIDEYAKVESLIIYYWHARLSFENKSVVSALQYSDRAIEMLTNPEIKRNWSTDKKAIFEIENQIYQIQLGCKQYKTESHPKIYKQSEIVRVKYTTGKIKEDKYKRFVKDIDNKKCSIIK